MAIVGRFLRLPRTLCWRVVDGWYVPALLRAAGVRYGARCRFVGVPVVRRHAEAQIHLGDGVGLYSRWNANVITLCRPCTLAACKPGAQIRVGAQAAMSGATIVSYASVTIGERTLLGADVFVADTDFHPLLPELRAQHPTNEAGVKPIVIGNDVFVGARSMILKGVTIGDGAVIGANAVVTRNVEPRTIVAGNPARAVGSLPLQQESMQ